MSPSSNDLTVYPQLSGPFCDGHGIPIKGYPSIHPGIIGLLNFGRPPAVSRLVVPFVVNPVYGMPCRRPSPHVGKEVLERIPPAIADDNSPFSVVLVDVVIGRIASLDHVSP